MRRCSAARRSRTRKTSRGSKSAFVPALTKSRPATSDLYVLRFIGMDDVGECDQQKQRSLSLRRGARREESQRSALQVAQQDTWEKGPGLPETESPHGHSERKKRGRDHRLSRCTRDCRRRLSGTSKQAVTSIPVLFALDAADTDISASEPHQSASRRWGFCWISYQLPCWRAGVWGEKLVLSGARLRICVRITKGSSVGPLGHYWDDNSLALN